MAKVKNYASQTMEFATEVAANYSAEFAPVPFNGLFVAMHKSAFENLGFALLRDNIIFGNCCSMGRGSASLQHITPGGLIPRFPTLPVDEQCATPCGVSLRLREPFMERALVIAGGHHLDNSDKYFDINFDNEKLMQFAKNVREKSRTQEARSSAYGQAEVLDLTSDNSDYVTQVFKTYFPDIVECERDDYLLYLAADTTCMISYALSAFEHDPDSVVANTVNAKNKMLREIEQLKRVHVHPKTYTCNLDNERLNMGADVKVHYRMVFNSNNPLISESGREGLRNVTDILEQGKDNDRTIQDYIDLMNSMLESSKEYCKHVPNRVVASQAASIVLNTHPLPVSIPKKEPWKTAEHALTDRLIHIAQLINKQLPGSLLNKKDVVALAALLEVYGNVISPNDLRTYRSDGDVTTLTTVSKDPWFKTNRQLILHKIFKEKSEYERVHGDSSPENIERVCFNALMGHTMMELVNVVGLESIYNAEEFITKYDLMAKEGTTLDPKEGKSMQVRVGASVMGKYVSSAPELILVHFYYDPELFKRYFLQYSHHLLKGEYLVSTMDDSNVIYTHPDTSMGAVRREKDEHLNALSLANNSCKACSTPFYRSTANGNDRFECCMCYVLLSVMAILTRRGRNYVILRNIFNTISLSRNPYSGEMTSMKFPITIRTVEGKSKYGGMGTIRIKHASVPDGFKVVAKRLKYEGEKKTKVEVASGAENSKQNSGQGDMQPNDTDDTNFSESVSVQQLLRVVYGKFSTVLSDNHRKVEECEESDSIGTYFKSVYNNMRGGGGDAPSLDVKFDIDKALRHHLLRLRHNDGDMGKRTVDCLRRESGVFRTVNREQVLVTRTETAMEWDDPTTASTSSVSAGRGGEGDNDVISMQNDLEEPPRKRRKQERVEGEKLTEDDHRSLRRLVKAVQHMVCSETNGANLEEMKIDDFGDEHARLLRRWEGATTKMQKRYAGQLKKYCRDSMLASSGSIIHNIFEEYLESLAGACRRVHELVAETLSQSPEELDEIALTDIVTLAKPQGHINTWFDPASAGRQVVARCEKLNHFAILKHIITRRDTANATELRGSITTESLNRYTQTPGAKLCPHSTPVAPLITGHFPTESGGSIKIAPTTSVMRTEICATLPVRTKVTIPLTGFSETDCSEDGKKTKEPGGAARVMVGDDVRNGGLFKCFPLLNTDCGDVGNAKFAVRSAEELSAQLRQRSLKISMLGRARTVDSRFTAEGTQHMTTYLLERRNSAGMKCHTVLIRLLLNDLHRVCGFVSKVFRCMRTLASLVCDKVAEKMFTALVGTMDQLRDSGRLVQYVLGELFSARPELLSTMYVIAVGSELYGPKTELRGKGVDGEKERDVTFVNVLVPTCLRLFVGRKGGGKVNRAADEKQTALLPVKSVYLDYVGEEPLVTITYRSGEMNTSAVMINNVNITSYAMKESSELVTKLQGCTRFPFKSLFAKIAHPETKTDEEIHLLKSSMAPGVSRERRKGGGEEDVLFTLDLGEMVGMMGSGSITVTQMAEHLAQFVTGMLSKNSAGKADDGEANEEKVFKVIQTERFNNEEQEVLTHFKEHYYHSIYEIMCGGVEKGQCSEDDELAMSIFDDDEDDSDDDDSDEL